LILFKTVNWIFVVSFDQGKNKTQQWITIDALDRNLIHTKWFISKLACKSICKRERERERKREREKERKREREKDMTDLIEERKRERKRERVRETSERER
jgi:hypothetical protein